MWRLIELAVLAFLISLGRIESALPYLELPSILQALNRSCVVIGVDLAADETYLDLLTALQATAFRNDEEVLIGTSTYSELTSDPRVKVKTQPAISSEHGSSILVLQRRPPDRKCLLTEKLVSKELKATVYKGRPDSGPVLAMINDVCGTYKTMDGGFDEKGQRRRRILGDLFTVEDGPKMKSIAEKCADQRGRLKEYFYTGRCQGDSELRLPTCETVDGTKLTKDEFFSEYLTRSKPVILKNLLPSVWPRSEEWSNDFFRQRFGERRVHIKLTPTGEFEGVEDASLWADCPSASQNQYCSSPLSEVPSEVKKHLKFSNHLVMVRPATADMTMNEFIDVIENRTKWMGYGGNLSAYLEYTPVGETFVGFDNDIPELPFVKGLLKLDLLNMWLSNGNTLGKLHFDEFDNFLCQVSGKKRLLLFEPHNNSRLYEGHIVEAELSLKDGRFVRHELMESTALTMSPVDIERPDFKTFPEFANAIPLNCTIEPGDILYLPSFWWHEVQSYPDKKQRRNLAFNFWYDPFLSKEFPCHDCKLDINSAYRHLL